MQKILIILGPTASGKSALAVELAERFGGEIISADSRQVYRGLDIATGKITLEEMRGIPHHLLDTADPDETFTASDFAELARRAIETIANRGKVPIICGGTGFYIDALMGRISIPEVAPDEALRANLAGKSAPQLFALLSSLDPRRAETIEQENPVRLIRAIEIATALGAVPEQTDAAPRYDALWIGIAPEEEELRLRIHERVRSRMERGMIAEAQQLHAHGLSYERMESLGLEYRALAAYLEGKMTEDALAALIEQNDLRYAKRQMTYWKRNKEIRWFTPDDHARIAGAAQEFLR